MQFFILSFLILFSSVGGASADVPAERASSKQVEGSPAFSMGGYFVGARANFNIRSFDKDFARSCELNGIKITEHNTDLGLGLEWGHHWMMKACFVGLYLDWNARLLQAKHFPSSFDISLGLRFGYLVGRFAPYLRMGARVLAIKFEPADTERLHGFSWDFGLGLDVLTECGFFYGADMGYTPGSDVFVVPGGLAVHLASTSGSPASTNNLFSEVCLHLRVGYHF